VYQQQKTLIITLTLNPNPNPNPRQVKLENYGIKTGPVKQKLAYI